MKNLGLQAVQTIMDAVSDKDDGAAGLAILQDISQNFPQRAL